MSIPGSYQELGLGQDQDQGLYSEGFHVLNCHIAPTYSSMLTDSVPLLTIIKV